MLMIFNEFQLQQAEILISNISMCVLLYLCFLVQLDDGLFVKLKHVAIGCKKYVLCLTIIFFCFYI